MSENKLSVDVRTEFGKGFARRLRAAGKIPAVLYGHGADVQHLALPAHQTGLIVRYANAIIDLDIDGKSQLALVKDVQRDPVRSIIEHIDLVAVRRGEKMTVDVPYTTEGESFPGTYITFGAAAISVEADAMNIPDTIVVDVEGLEDGTNIFAKDLTLPEGVTLVDDPELHVLSVTMPTASDEDDASDDAGGEAEASGTEESE